MKLLARPLRTPEERVGVLPNGSLPPPPRTETETHEELLRQALEHGDERSFARVLDLFFPAMLRLALRHVDSRATAEEVVQETWLAAIHGIDRFESRSSVTTWLFHILRNIARTRGRRDARTRTFSELEGTGGDAADPHARLHEARTGAANSALWMRASHDPEEDLLSNELVAHIDRAIAALPPRQREVIMLRDVEGWSAADVCNAIGISQTNQRVILHRARDRVRQALHGYLTEGRICDGPEHEVP